MGTVIPPILKNANITGDRVQSPSSAALKLEMSESNMLRGLRAVGRIGAANPPLPPFAKGGDYWEAREGGCGGGPPLRDTTAVAPRAGAWIAPEAPLTSILSPKVGARGRADFYAHGRTVGS
jgi:hypothetical protein